MCSDSTVPEEMQNTDQALVIQVTPVLHWGHAEEKISSEKRRMRLTEGMGGLSKILKQGTKPCTYAFRIKHEQFLGQSSDKTWTVRLPAWLRGRIPLIHLAPWLVYIIHSSPFYNSLLCLICVLHPPFPHPSGRAMFSMLTLSHGHSLMIISVAPVASAATTSTLLESCHFLEKHF